MRASVVPRFVQSAPLCRHERHGRPLSHLMRRARHQSQALETCFRKGRVGLDGEVAAVPERSPCGSGECCAKVGYMASVLRDRRPVFVMAKMLQDGVP